uniref:LAAT1 protein n=1 Tax=Chelonoidis abingdonii TaxID=106734 RepID=A0A8C0G5E3_CHEAB
PWWKRAENRRLCINGTPWIWQLLEECVENAWEYWSVVIGLISIVCFLFAALPQLYVAYQNGKVDQALSLGFLLCWIVGDLTNFIGCYLTNQLPSPLWPFTAALNCFEGSSGPVPFHETSGHNAGLERKINCKLKPLEMLKGIFNQNIFVLLLVFQNTLGMIEMSGFICGYVSCMFYLGSRFPQLYKNFQRRSTEGTSYLLFALAMMGNCTYGLSLVLKMPAAESLRNLYFLHHLPWLIGSFGVLFLDIFVSFFS